MIELVLHQPNQLELQLTVNKAETEGVPGIVRVVNSLEEIVDGPENVLPGDSVVMNAPDASIRGTTGGAGSGSILHNIPSGDRMNLLPVRAKYMTSEDELAESQAKIISASEDAYNTDAETIPNFTVFEPDGETVHAKRDIIHPTFTMPPPAEPDPAKRTALALRTGYTTSIIAGDDGATQRGRGASILLLSDLNPLGNYNRFTQVNDSSVYADWEQYDQRTGMVQLYDSAITVSLTAEQHIAAALLHSAGGFSVWDHPNRNELAAIQGIDGAGGVNAPPFNTAINGGSLSLSTSTIVNGSQAVFIGNAMQCLLAVLATSRRTFYTKKVHISEIT